MQYRRNLILNNLNIILWKLRYPVVFSQDAPIQLLTNLRLLIISDMLIALDDSFIEDVLYTMHLTAVEVYLVTVDRINTLIFPLKLIDYCWLIGIKMLCSFCYVTLQTPSLSVLKNNTNAKRDLWNQINRCLKY